MYVSPSFFWIMYKKRQQKTHSIDSTTQKNKRQRKSALGIADDQIRNDCTFRRSIEDDHFLFL